MLKLFVKMRSVIVIAAALSITLLQLMLFDSMELKVASALERSQDRVLVVQFEPSDSSAGLSSSEAAHLADRLQTMSGVLSSGWARRIGTTQEFSESGSQFEVWEASQQFVDNVHPDGCEYLQGYLCAGAQVPLVDLQLGEHLRLDGANFSFGGQLAAPVRQPTLANAVLVDPAMETLVASSNLQPVALSLVFESPPAESIGENISALVNPEQVLEVTVFGGGESSSNARVGNVLVQLAPISFLLGLGMLLAVSGGLAVADSLAMAPTFGLLQTLGASESEIKNNTVAASCRVVLIGFATSLLVIGNLQLFGMALWSFVVPMPVGEVMLLCLAGACSYIVARYLVALHVLKKDPAAIHRGS